MAEINVTIEDNSQQIKEELDRAVEQVLFSWGLAGVAGCVEKASEPDSATGRPTVSTGRYRSAFGFITPQQGRMTPKNPEDERNPDDDISGKRSQKDTVIIANNVEYAPYLEFGSGTKEGGRHARYIMKRGIESKIETMKKDMEQIMKGQGTMTVSGIGGGEN